MTERILSTVNYIVPAAGTTRGYAIEETFVADVVKTVDFRNAGLDGQPFRPSGVYVDNTQGTADLRVVINEIGYSIVVKAGVFSAVQYPAPMQQSANITGEGRAVLVFVDFPVIPFTSANAALGAIPDGADVALGATTDLAKSGAQDGTALARLRYMSQILANLDTYASQSLTELGEINVDTLAIKADISSLKTVMRGVDSLGAALPDDFQYLPRTLTYDGNNNVQTEVVTKAPNTWTKTYTYTGINLTAISAWVKA